MLEGETSSLISLSFLHTNRHNSNASLAHISPISAFKNHSSSSTTWSFGLTTLFQTDPITTTKMGDSEGFTTVSRDRRRRSTTCQSSPPNRQYSDNWQDGEIAFLKPHCQFNPAAYKDLIDSGYLHVKATGHPVIGT